MSEFYFWKGNLPLLLVSVTFLFMAPVTAQTICNNDIGNQGGFTYEYWKDQGSGCMVLGSGGTFSVDWSNINNLLARKGLRPGSMNQTVTYAADYQPNGNSYLCVYGWTTGPLVEYYIVDNWGSWRPPGGSPKGTITTDGGTYDIYETTRTQQPSIEGTRTFQQYWSVRRTRRSSGTITCANHFAGWARAGMPMGNLYEVSFTVEGYQSSGTADVYQLSMGTGSGGNNGGGNPGGDSSGDREYTLTVRASGVTGEEHLNVRINNEVQAEINLTTGMQEYEVYVDRGDLNLEFDNDAGSRDVRVDWIEIHGETRQAEDMEYNTAVYQNGSCGGSYSESMNCNGVIGFGDITYQGGQSGSSGYPITVRASGAAGGEHLNVLVDNQVVGEITLTGSLQDYPLTVPAGDLNIEFDNDGGSRDVRIDYVNVNGSVLQAENMEYNTGVYQNGSCGGSYSEMLHCNGRIGFGTIVSSANASAARSMAPATPMSRTTVAPVDATFDLFPNPTASGRAEVYVGDLKAGTANVELRDVSGRQLASRQAVSYQKLTFDRLSAGIYFVHLTVGEMRTTKKLVVN